MFSNHILKLIPLGGVGEVTKNMYVYEYGDDQIIVDCGFGFPKENDLGIDVVIPDISYLENSSKKIRGILLTHGHLDHIGGLPYILPRLKDVPVFGSKLTIALASTKIKEFGVKNPLKVVEDKLKLGPFDIKFIHTTHSIPNCKHILIKTPAATIYHGADFKFDLTPLDNKPADFTSMASIGSGGVDLMLTDCLRVEKQGFTPSERNLLEAIDNEVRKTRGKFIFTTMSSSISRIEMAIHSAAKYGRKVALVGRSIEQNILAAIDNQFIKIPQGALVKVDKIKRLKPHQVALIVAGSQGQEGSAMHRAVTGEHRFINIHPSDHIVISSDAIPGNEGAVYSLIDAIHATGASVSYSGSTPNLHVTGHGYSGDLSLLVRLIKPKHIIPIGGNLRHMVMYQDMVKPMGYPKEQVHIPKDGQVIEISRGKVKLGTRLEMKNIYVDGLGIGDVGKTVLQDRQVMAGDGMLIAIVPVNKATGKINGDVEIVSRGFVYAKESKDLLDKIKKQVDLCLGNDLGRISNWRDVRGKIEQSLSKFIYKNTERNPLILAVIVEV